jgi:hypothetical protein
MQDTKLSFEDGDFQEKPQTNNQGEEDFLDQFSFLCYVIALHDYKFTHVVQFLQTTILL